VNPPPRPDLEVEHPLSVLSCHPASVRPVRHRNVTPWATGRAARCRSTRCPIAPSAAPPDHPQGPDPQVRQHAAGGGTLLASASSGQAGDGVGVAGKRTSPGDSRVFVRVGELVCRAFGQEQAELLLRRYRPG